MTLRFDENADAAVHPAAWEAYAEASQLYANPSSSHADGRAAKARLEQARGDVASAIGAEPDEIVFTSGGTEADALAILGACISKRKPHVVSTSIEHAAVAKNLDRLVELHDADVTRVAVSHEGRVDVEEIKDALRDNTVLVSVVGACNETGVVQPIREIGHALREHQAMFHTDVVQGLGRMPVDVHQWGADLASFSAHKVGAVGGIGALYIRRGVVLRPLFVGGGHERGVRASTENVAGAASLAEALKHAPKAADWMHMAKLRDQLEQGLCALGHVEVIGAQQQRLCNTSCIRFEGCEGDGIMMAMDIEGVAVSTGSACSSGSIEPSPILLGMGFTPAQAKETVRFSLSPSATSQDVQQVVQLTADIVQRMRATR